MTQAKVGDTVRVHYTGKLEDGTVFDSTENAPMDLTLGQGTIIPGFEEAILGMAPGESKTERVPYDRAYGPRQEEMMIEVDRALFAQQDVVPEEGLRLQVTSSNGQPLPVVVTQVSEANVTLDANHPL